MSAPECCIAGADGQPRPCRSMWLLAFREREPDGRQIALPRVSLAVDAGVVHRGVSAVAGRPIQHSRQRL
jgi:hypothetical protein